MRRLDLAIRTLVICVWECQQSIERWDRIRWQWGEWPLPHPFIHQTIIEHLLGPQCWDSKTLHFPWCSQSLGIEKLMNTIMTQEIHAMLREFGGGAKNDSWEYRKDRQVKWGKGRRGEGAGGGKPLSTEKTMWNLGDFKINFKNTGLGILIMTYKCLSLGKKKGDFMLIKLILIPYICMLSNPLF